MSETIDWKKFTVAELRDHCTKNGLAATGKKQDLIDRLQEHKANETSTDAEVKEEVMESNGDAEAVDAGEEKEAMDVKEEDQEEAEEIKAEGEEEEAEDKEEEKKEEPVMVLRGKFHFFYNVNHALKMVIIKPFTEDIFSKPEFIKWSKEAKGFDIQKMKDETKEAVLYFDTLAKGDGAFAELKATVENEEVKVLHPATADTSNANNSVSVSAGQYWTKLSEYSQLARAPVTMDESKSETLFGRLVVLENVPDEVTEDDLVEKFPEAFSVHLFPYSDACKGIRMLEFTNCEKATTFARNNKELTLADQPIKVEKYSARIVAWEKAKPRNEPYKPCSLEDEERVEKCKQLKELEVEKNSILNRDDLFGEEKYLEHTKVFDQIKPLIEQLKMDTNRRKAEKLSFPEPDELKNNYTKFAEAPDFSKRKKQSIFGKKSMAPGHKRGYDGGNRGYGDQPPHKRQMMQGGGGGGYGYNRGYGGGYGGGRGGGGNSNLMAAVQGLTTALSTMERSMGGRGGRGGGFGGGAYGGGGGYNRGGMRRF